MKGRIRIIIIDGTASGQVDNPLQKWSQLPSLMQLLQITVTTNMLLANKDIWNGLLACDLSHGVLYLLTIFYLVN